MWCLNNAYVWLEMTPRVTRWFELHNPELYTWRQRRPDKHVEWLKAFHGPVYLQEGDQAIPNGVRFPLEEVWADLGRGVARGDGGESYPYLTSSISYMLALAIHEGYDEIRLYGIDLNTQGEYAWQKAGCEYLLGLAQGRGITVWLPDNCPLLEGTLYGRGFLQPGGEHVSRQQWETRLRYLEEQEHELMVKAHQLQGASMGVQSLLKELPPGLERKNLERRAAELGRAAQEHLLKAKHVGGALAEARYWIHQTPEGMDPRRAIKAGKAGLIETQMLVAGENGMLVAAGPAQQHDEGRR